MAEIVDFVLIKTPVNKVFFRSKRLSKFASRVSGWLSQSTKRRVHSVVKREEMQRFFVPKDYQIRVFTRLWQTVHLSIYLCDILRRRRKRDPPFRGGPSSGGPPRKGGHGPGWLFKFKIRNRDFRFSVFQNFTFFEIHEKLRKHIRFMSNRPFGRNLG